MPIAVTMLLVDYFSCTQNLDLVWCSLLPPIRLLFAELVSESSVISLDTNSTIIGLFIHVCLDVCQNSQYYKLVYV